MDKRQILIIARTLENRGELQLASEVRALTFQEFKEGFKNKIKQGFSFLKKHFGKILISLAALTAIVKMLKDHQKIKELKIKENAFNRLSDENQKLKKDVFDLNTKNSELRNKFADLDLESTNLEERIKDLSNINKNKDERIYRNIHNNCLSLYYELEHLIRDFRKTMDNDPVPREIIDNLKELDKKLGEIQYYRSGNDFDKVFNFLDSFLSLYHDTLDSLYEHILSFDKESSKYYDRGNGFYLPQKTIKYLTQYYSKLYNAIWRLEILLKDHR